MQIKEFKLSDISSAAELVKISVLYNNHPWGTSGVIQLRKSYPLISETIVHFTGLGALLDVPRADNDNVLVSPGNDTMCISGILHVCKSYQFPICFVNLIDRLQVCLRICNAPTCDVDGAADLDALTVPDVRNVFVTEHTLFLRPSLHVEHYDVVVVEKVKPDLAQLYLDDCTNTSRNLDIVVKS